MDLSINTNCKQTFTAKNPKHAVHSIGEVMSELYKRAYNNEMYQDAPDIIQISTKMRDGKEIVAVADFIDGQYIGLSFPHELAHYRKEFCKKILDKYNTVITKGKCNRH